MYESMVRPHLELLEGVQKLVLRMCSKGYDMNYEDLLQSFLLP